MEKDHYSKEWDDAPMPHSIFFTRVGHAIHGSYETRKIGSPASAGCVRLEPENAETLFALVEKQGVLNTTVEVTGDVRVALARRTPQPAATEEDGNVTPRRGYGAPGGTPSRRGRATASRRGHITFGRTASLTTRAGRRRPMPRRPVLLRATTLSALLSLVTCGGRAAGKRGELDLRLEPRMHHVDIRRRYAGFDQ